MNWPEIFSALEQLAALADIDPRAVVWRAKAQGFQAGSRIVMSIRSLRSYGQDVEKIIDDPEGGPQTVLIEGQRSFIWVLRFESNNASADKMALGVLEGLRARLSRSSIQPIVKAANISILDNTQPAQEVRVISNNRALSVYELAVMVGAVESDVDTTTDAGQWVETVNFESDTIENLDGTSVAPQINETVSANG